MSNENMNKEELQRTQWSENLRQFVGSPANEERIQLLAERSGLDRTRVFITCCTSSNNDADIRRLHEVMVDYLKELREAQNKSAAPSQENSSTNGGIETYSEQFTSMRKELIDFLNNNERGLAQIADMTGLTPEQVQTLANSEKLNADGLTLLYTSMSNLKEAEVLDNENTRKAM